MVRKKSVSGMIFDTFNYIFLTLLALVCLYPVYHVLIGSFSDPVQLNRHYGAILKPLGFSLEGYKVVFHNPNIWSGYANTLFYVVVGTLCRMLFTLIGAYLLSRKDFVIRKGLTFIMVFTMYFSGGMIPTYLAMKSFGLLNSPFAVIFPGAVNVTNLIIARTYFATSIPWELQEAATIDGCSNTGLFLKIVLPLSMPIVAVIALYYLVGHWNAYFNALIYLSNEKLYPLQLFLRNILLMDQMTEMMEGDSEALQALMRRLQLKESMKYGIVVLSSLPVLVIYPFLQKYFVKGVMIGAVKG